MTYDPEKVWRTMQADQEFVQLPDETKKLFRTLVDDVPKFLGPHLDKTVTAHTFATARHATAEFKSRTGFQHKFVQILRDAGEPDLVSDSDLTLILQEQVDMAKQAVDDSRTITNGSLARAMTPALALIVPFWDYALSLGMNTTMTIQEVLEIAPAAIFMD